MSVENGINWATLVSAEGVVVPTYGAYGGPHYTGGQIDPAAFVDAAPLDPLDSLFKAHDLAYFSIPSTDAEALAIADLTLINGIRSLPDSDMGGEAHLYAGGAELALLHNVVENYGRGDLLTPQQQTAILADAADNLHQATINPENPAEQLGVIQVLSQSAAHDLNWV
jgi:hypothetical protein